MNNACALIASGVTETMQCESSQPVSIRWVREPSSRLLCFISNRLHDFSRDPVVRWNIELSGPVLRL